MKKLILVYILCGITHLCSAQRLRDDISIQQHRVDIPYTGVNINVPANATVAKSFHGLTCADAVIEVLDLPGGNFFSAKANASRDSFEKKGNIVTDYKETSLNGYPARYLCVKLTDAGYQHILMFGDSSFCTFVKATVSTANPVFNTTIRQDLLTIIYTKQHMAESLADAPFKLTDTVTQPFRFTRSILKTYSFIAVDHEYNDTANISVSLELALKDASVLRLTDNLMAALQKAGMRNIKVSKQDTKTISGYYAGETVATAYLNDKKIRLYIAVLQKDERNLCIVGYSPFAMESAVDNFKKFARSVRLRKQSAGKSN
jgi:hypothetical protein